MPQFSFIIFKLAANLFVYLPILKTLHITEAFIFNSKSLNFKLCNIEGFGLVTSIKLLKILLHYSLRTTDSTEIFKIEIFYRCLSFY